jgi:hypothetical protein
MNKLLLAAAGTVLAASTATAASAGTFIFNEGTFGAPVNFTLYDDFNYTNVADDSKVTGHGYDFFTGDIPARSASIPGNATPYLSVDGGGQANIMFTDPVRSFSFDYSTVDTYNTLTIIYADNSTQSFTGTEILAGFPTGTTSGNLIVNGNGSLIKGLQLDTTSAAFEVDNLSVSANLVSGVPEAGTWAMMLIGFGGIGALSRGRRTSLTFA